MTGGSEPPGELLVARFRADVERLLARPLGRDTLALAVSGGPDSMAMLALGATAYPSQVIAATVDHGLRAESAAEADMVGRWCASSGIPHATLTITVPPGASGNLQSWARQERYGQLRRWAIARDAGLLCTAHHAEDQAETFLMRAARGSGLSGLAAIRAATPVTFGLSAETQEIEEGLVITVDQAKLTLLRPMLSWRRAELRGLCERLELPFVDDPSNANDRFDRTRFRGWLEAAPWIDPVRIGQSAQNLAEIDADLLELSQWLWSQRTRSDDDDEPQVDVSDLPRAATRWLAKIAIEEVRSSNGILAPAWSTGTNIEPFLEALESGRAATHAGVMASPTGTIWHFRPAPPRRSR